MRFTELEETLCRLPAVDAVRVVGDNGRISEVHVLASAGKPAKQVVRDVQSLAMASFGLNLDRRVISVVQIESQEIAQADRPAILDITEKPDGDKTTVTVTLSWHNEQHVGEATGAGSSTTRLRLVGEAAVDALEQAVGESAALSLSALEIPVVGAREIAIAQVVMVAGGEERLLAGCALVGPDPTKAAVRAVLDALNRIAPQLRR